jgi:hypothetical protein
MTAADEGCHAEWSWACGPPRETKVAVAVTRVSRLPHLRDGQPVCAGERDAPATAGRTPALQQLFNIRLKERFI